MKSINHNNQGIPDESGSKWLGHLIALRKVLLRSAISVGFLFLCLLPFSQKLYHILALPLVKHLPNGSELIATHIAAPFIAPLKWTIIVALFIGIPIVLSQCWGFISPGLYKSEKKLAGVFLLLSILLFYSGMAFAYFIIFPIVFHFLLNLPSHSITVMPDISHYLSFSLKLLFAFGLAFEVPIVVLLCIYSGVTSVQTLAKQRPYWFVSAFVLGMLLTPPDVISQILLAIPMWLLFEMGLLGARFLPNKKINKHKNKITS